MNLQEKVNVQFAQIENLIVEAVENGAKVENSLFGTTIDGLFISNTGAIILNVKTRDLRRLIADTQIKALESDVTFYRDKLAEAEELLAQTKGFAQ